MMFAVKASRATRRPGSVTVWVLLSMDILVGIVALGMDGGRMMEERRRVQMTADAAALAAAADLYENFSLNQGKDPGLTAKNAALSSASANGYTNDGVQSIVTVNVAPLNGSFAGQAGYAEVIVQSNLDSTFGAVFTGSTLPVKASAVARGQPKQLGVLVLAATGGNAFFNNMTSGTATVTNAPIVVDSSDPHAFHQDKSSTTVATSFQITGNYQLDVGGTMTGTISTGVQASLDPLAGFAAPQASNYTIRSLSTLNLSGGSTTLQPGVYEGGIQISNTANVTLSAGVYIMDGGGFQVASNAKGTISGSGVMIYNTSITHGAGSVQIQPKNPGTVNLSAPTSGTYQGISIFQDRSLNQAVTIIDNSNIQITGTVYASAAPVNVTSSGTLATDVLGGAYVCKTLTIQGDQSFSINLGTNRPKLPDVHLAE